MIVITNEKLIKRNRLLGKIASIASMLILGGGLFLTFKDKTGEYYLFTFMALIAGFMLSQFGIYYGNRWGRSPRPDESLNQMLKGLDDRFTLIHYSSPVNHLLLAPSGIWILLPYYQGGVITYDETKNRWKQKGGNAYLKIFGQENLGRPDMDIKYNLDDLQRALAKAHVPADFPQPQALLVFTNKKATLETKNTPVPALPAEKIKDFFRKSIKDKPLRADQVEAINQAFGVTTALAKKG